MKRLVQKGTLSVTLIASLLVMMLSSYSSITRAASLGGNSNIQPYAVGNIRYAVAFMYYDIWKDSSGAWTTKKPGDRTSMINSYSFSFPNRTVKDLTVLSYGTTSDPGGIYFNNSRVGENYLNYKEFLGLNQVTSQGTNILGLNTSSITFDLSVSGVLGGTDEDAPHYSLRYIDDAHACSTCGPEVDGYRYFFPILLKFELNGRMDVRHFKTDGTNIDSSFPDQSLNLTGSPETIIPAANANYDYVGYKKSTVAPPTGGSITPGNPPTVTYDATYDTYYLNLYYEDKSTDGKAVIKHFDTDGNSLSGIAGLSDREQTLKEGTAYAFAHDPPPNGYVYAGYKKSTTSGSPPSGGAILAGEYNLGTYSSATFAKTVYLYYYYDVDKSATAGEINIRHMTRSGPTGTYTLAKQQTIPVASLPFNSSYSSDGTYGNVQGSNLSYVAYSNTVTPSTSQTVSLTAMLSKAYLTFFYEQPQSFTGDFDVLPDTLPYKASFTLHPKNFQLNGCTYLSHAFKIERNGQWTGAPVYGQTTDSVYGFGSYPWVIGVGTHQVSMRIATSCGISDWIGPKPLHVTGPTVNRPPTFQIGFVDPAEPTKPLHQIIEGSVLDLIYINDPAVPTPTDPDGDSLYFMGFDFAAGNAFVQSIPSKSVEYVDGQHKLTMDNLGYQYVCAQMRDEFGAAAQACTYIEVVPKNPVPLIDCPPSVIANHPLAAGAINGNRSYSPVKGQTIDHARDEWTNKQNSYANAGSTDITVQVSLHVYDRAGLRSLAPAVCTIIVKPDLPPIAKLVVPPLSVRGTELELMNQSTSPDGDAIISAEYGYKYDANNNGFADDAWTSLTGTVEKLTFKPTKVGSYYFSLKVAEAYGQWDDTASDPPSSLTLNVVNNAPEVSFQLQGNNPQPNLDPYVRIKPAAMINWPIYVPGTNRLVYNNERLWRANEDAGQLVGGEGRNFGMQDPGVYYYAMTRFSTDQLRFDAPPLANNGYGSNELSPWRAALQSDVVANLLDENGQMLNFYAGSYPKVRSTKHLVLFDKHDRNYYWNEYQQIGSYIYNDYIYALNTQKLSKVIDTYDGGGIKQKYEKGSPYAYVIHFSSSDRKVISYKNSNNVLYKNVTVYGSTMLDYELADQYLYVRRQWKGDLLNGNGNIYPQDIAVYDVRTGKELASSFDSAAMSTDVGTLLPGLKDRNASDFVGGLSGMITSGQRLLVNYASGNGNGVGQAFRSWYTITPDFHVSKKASWLVPEPHFSSFANTYNGLSAADKQKWNYVSLGSTMDASGAIYAYEGWASQNGGAVYDLNVTKYKADYSLAWRTYLTAPAGQAFPNNSRLFSSAFYYPEVTSDFFLNPGGKEIYARMYYDYLAPGNVWPDGKEAVAVIDTANGALKKQAEAKNGDDLKMYHYGDPDYQGEEIAYSADFAGNVSPKGRRSTTADGYKTSMSRANGESVCDGSYPTMYTQFGTNRVYDASGIAVGSVKTGCNYSVKPEYGEYVGDGVYLSMSQSYPTGAGGSGMDNMRLTLSVGKPTTNAKIEQSFTGGQFYSPFSLGDAEIKFSLRVDDYEYDEENLGFSFRMQDPDNRYSLETDGSVVALIKYEDGKRSVLASLAYPLLDGKSYAVKLTMNGGHMAVALDNAPLFEVDDESFETGRFGYFANKSFVTFSGLAYKPIVNEAVWSDQYAIWDAGSASAEVQYSDIAFLDPEGDPPAGGNYDWNVRHTARFIHNQGISELDGRTYRDAQLKFDKVGDYVVTLSAKDDPNPDYLSPSDVFAEYRKSSNTFTQRITVHRRPIARFTLATGTDEKLVWSDGSYDPDRYYSAADYSDENTGIDYAATKGIVQKKFYYVAPSGTYKEAKLVSPQELGTYEVGMAVRDEYGAWSEWYVVLLPIDKLPAPNNPPVPGFTADRLTAYRGVPILFDSKAYDLEDGDRTKLPHAYAIKNKAASGEGTFQSDSRTSWSKTFMTLGSFEVKQTVEDSEGATAAFGLQVDIVNRKPAATITAPESDDQANPTKLTVLRPDFKWRYEDADSDGQARYEMKIYRYGGVSQYESGVKYDVAEHWTPGADLPERVNMYVIVRVYDGYEWSAFSAPKFFYIETNRPPEGDFDWLPKPAYEGDLIALTTDVDDPDGDALAVAYKVRDPAGEAKTYGYALTSPYGTNGPVFRGALAGTYEVELSVSDGKAPPVLATKFITVLPLSVSGQVRHTDAWNDRRIESNAKAGGDANGPRGYNVFWAGERFVLRADTTDTATATVANAVNVTMNGRTITLSPLNAGRTKWGGEMWEEAFGQLPDGPLAFSFQAVYSNGTVKYATVTVEIAGNAQQTVGVHRRQ